MLVGRVLEHRLPSPEKLDTIFTAWKKIIDNDARNGQKCTTSIPSNNESVAYRQRSGARLLETMESQLIFAKKVQSVLF